MKERREELRRRESFKVLVTSKSYCLRKCTAFCTNACMLPWLDTIALSKKMEEERRK